MSKHRVFVTVFTGLYLIFIAWFVVLYLTRTIDGIGNLYSNTYGIIPLVGGLYGLFLARHWGGFKTMVGKAIFFLSSGLVMWGIGMAIWLYYNIILGIDIPYPSFADVVFILSWPLWTIGAVFLSFATGVNLELKNLKGKLFLLLIPIIVTVFSYYFLVVIARQGIVSAYDDIIKTFFDLAYPVGDVVILTIATLVFGLSYKYLVGRYKTAIYLILAGFVTNYFADFTFSYMTTTGTYYNGSISDVLYVTAMMLVSMGVIGFALPDYKNQKFNIITLNTFGANTIFHKIILKIIQKQEVVIGPSAWNEANNVAGFTVDRDNSLVSFSGDGKEAVDRLVLQYEKLLGKASRQACKESVRDLIDELPPEEVPDSLK